MRSHSYYWVAMQSIKLCEGLSYILLLVATNMCWVDRIDQMNCPSYAVAVEFQGSIYQHSLVTPASGIGARLRNYIHVKQWDIIIQPYHNFTGDLTRRWRYAMDEELHPTWKYSSMWYTELNHVDKRKSWNLGTPEVIHYCDCSGTQRWLYWICIRLLDAITLNIR